MKALSPGEVARRRWQHDMEMAQRANHGKPVCPDCFKPAAQCLHREAWEFLCLPVRK